MLPLVFIPQMEFDPNLDVATSLPSDETPAAPSALTDSVAAGGAFLDDMRPQLDAYLTSQVGHFARTAD